MVPLNWKQKTRISPWRLIPSQRPHGLHSMLLILCVRNREHTYFRLLWRQVLEKSREKQPPFLGGPATLGSSNGHYLSAPCGPSFPTRVPFTHAHSPYLASPSFSELDPHPHPPTPTPHPFPRPRQEDTIAVGKCIVSQHIL